MEIGGVLRLMLFDDWGCFEINDILVLVIFSNPRHLRLKIRGDLRHVEIALGANG